MANILGINLTELSEAEALKKIAAWLDGQSQHYIVTPNPEIILCASKDEELFYILNKADLALADGFGLRLAGGILGEKIIRVTGADLSVRLLETAARQGTNVAILNWSGGLSDRQEITTALQSKFPGLKFKVMDIDRVKILPENILTEIKAWSPNLLFTTLGFPYQEKLLYHNLKSLPSVKVALGVGGTFDFLSGRAQRAPKLVRTLGGEWLWRLIKQPRRIKRIYNATVIFLTKVLVARFIHHWQYRPSVACLLYKNDPNGKKILLVERQGEPGHWQLPQGGTDGEDLITAGARELREEINSNNFTGRASFKNLHHYEFNVGGEKNNFRGAIIQRHTFDYKGQKQSLFIAEYQGDDADIKINFWDHSAWKWVVADQLVREVHPSRRTGAKIYLEKFNSLNL